ncbi:TipAS antibiotic-recognition domain-containing protein [Dysosmobacter sp.]|uniref:TipAS antibiotic-recognition domain-containing protein n=1 Tax=Dysosmobacter sp. TaxID=2591382 RepID=UPI003A9086F7
MSPASTVEQAITALHCRRLTITGNPYDLAKHRGIAELYQTDERFTAYYDRHPLRLCTLPSGCRGSLGELKERPPGH